MGVIHKLKMEVITFILSEKKMNPLIGVRQLAGITSQKFLIKVSKSSVNNVLKSASLSSSVGRRGGAIPRGEKFSIPSKKKNEISQNMQKAGLIKEKNSDKDFIRKKIDAVSQKTNVKEDVLMTEGSWCSQSPIVAQPETTENETASQVPEDTKADESKQEDQNFLKTVAQARDQYVMQRPPLLRGMGFIFFKAAQWEISAGHFMRDMIQKCIGGHLSRRFNAASDMFLSLQLLGVTSMDKMSVDRGHGLWMLNNCCQDASVGDGDVLELGQLFELDKTLQDVFKRKLAVEYGLEKDYAFRKVKSFKVFLENGAILFVDAAMSSFGVWSMPQSVPCRLLAMDKALTRLSSCLVSNNQDCIFQYTPGVKTIDQSFYTMVMVFENIPGHRITKISIENRDNHEIAAFSTIPGQKRAFMAGIGPWQREFHEITKTVKWAEKKPFYHQGVDKIYHFTETRTGFFASRLQSKRDEFRMITLWEEKINDPLWLVLTNRDNLEAKTILDNYLSRWPYLGEQQQDISNLSAECSWGEGGSPSIGSIKDVFKDFAFSIHLYGVQQYFPQSLRDMGVNDFIERIYDIPGAAHQTEDCLRVSLQVPSSWEYIKALEYAVKRVNESCVFDYSKRRLWLSISQTS